MSISDILIFRHTTLFTLSQRIYHKRKGPFREKRKLNIAFVTSCLNQNSQVKKNIALQRIPIPICSLQQQLETGPNNSCSYSFFLPPLSYLVVYVQKEEERDIFVKMSSVIPNTFHQALTQTASFYSNS
jgi:hypothetical protein